MFGQDPEGQSIGQHSGPSFSRSTVSSLHPTSPSPKATSVCTWKSEVRVSVFRKWVLYETWSRGLLRQHQRVWPTCLSLSEGRGLSRGLDLLLSPRPWLELLRLHP